MEETERVIRMDVDVVTREHKPLVVLIRLALKAAAAEVVVATEDAKAALAETVVLEGVFLEFLE